MGQYKLPATLDTFFEVKDKCLQFNYITLVFQLESARWDTEVSRYVQWIMECFRQSPEGHPKFLIFFVIHTPQTPHSTGALSEIQRVVHEAPDGCLVLENLNPVNREALCAWFRNVSTIPDELKIETIIDGFARQLQYQLRWDGRSDFDMMDVEPLFERVYLKWLKK